MSKPGITGGALRHVYYFGLFPNLLLSPHPDYVLTHRIEPLAPDLSHVVCTWYFPPEAASRPGFDPSYAVDFWDLTNRQDWHVCELQQRGTASRSWVAGRYSNQEPSVHAFDLMVADRLVDDGVRSRRTIRERYDVPVPKDGAPA